VRYYLDPFGCVKNQVDAETMMDLLNNAQWSGVEDPGEADLIIINSCGFIERAKQESINAVLGYRKTYPDKKIILAGCLAQRYAQELAESLPEADLLFGNRDVSKIIEAVSAVSDRLLIPAGSENSAVSGKRPLLSLPGSAYIKISEGCNNHCTFCAIPRIRGPLVSRQLSDILTECRELLERGIQELCLIGQDLGSYLTDHSAESGLPELLEALSKREEQFWVRLLYIHPDNFPLKILDIIRRDPRFLPYFDLPFQHGSQRVLRAMNRQGTAASYLGLLDRIREVLPDAVLRSTFLTGFPGETAEDFEQLLDFQDKAHLDWAGCFAYSREEDTPAYAMKPRIPKTLGLKRKQYIEERQRTITEKQMERFIGRDFDVLVEERVVNEEGLYLGRLFCHAPEVDGSAVIRSDRPLRAGAIVRGSVFALAGFDLEVRVNS
jgi:ribosomal protein S12 methylthiotransferase